MKAWKKGEPYVPTLEAGVPVDLPMDEVMRAGVTVQRKDLPWRLSGEAFHDPDRDRVMVKVFAGTVEGELAVADVRVLCTGPSGTNSCGRLPEPGHQLCAGCGSLVPPPSRAAVWELRWASIYSDKEGGTIVERERDKVLGVRSPPPRQTNRTDVILRRRPTVEDLDRARAEDKIIITILEGHPPEYHAEFVEGFLSALGLHESDRLFLYWTKGLDEELVRESLLDNLDKVGGSGLDPWTALAGVSGPEPTVDLEDLSEQADREREAFSDAALLGWDWPTEKLASSDGCSASVKGLEEGAPFDLVPRVVEVTKEVVGFQVPLSNDPPPRVSVGQRFYAWTNTLGAVAAILPGGDGGRDHHLGLKPNEFKVLTWWGESDNPDPIPNSAEVESVMGSDTTGAIQPQDHENQEV